MYLSKKQELYLEILERILPSVRNLETHPYLYRAIWYPIRFGSFFPELELVHNLHRCLIYPEFQKRDIWWLNCQARNYVQEGRKRNRPHYSMICSLIEELLLIVPEELRSELTWLGPLDLN